MSSFGNTLTGAVGATTGLLTGGPVGALVGGLAGSTLGGLSQPQSSGYSPFGSTYQQYPLPASFSSPFGSLTNDYGATTFNPVVDPSTQYQISAENNQINNLVSNLPNQLNANDPYNNPLYNSTYQNLANTIGQQQQLDQSSLNNQLNASNQLGSSYDALRQQQLAQNYNLQYLNAANMAQQTSANQYNQSLQNTLASLASLRNDQNAAYNNIYQPARVAASFI